MRPALPLLAAAVTAACGGGLGDRREPVGLSVPYEIDTLDPHARNTLSNFSVVAHFYEPLVTTDADLKIHPALARLWENPDRTTWVFHLRPGVTFHDGSPLDARDVVFSLRRLMTDERLEMTGYVLYITDVEALGPLMVRIRTARPLSILLNKLRFVSIVPAGSTREQLASRPNGTGPYVLAGWERGRSVRMTRNDGYWGGKPALRSVALNLDRSPEEAAQDLLSGRSLLVQCNTRKAEAALRGVSRFDVTRRPSLFLKYLGFDLVREITPYASVRPNPFRDVRIRRAIHAALDRARLVRGLASDAVPAAQPVPPTIFGFNPRLPPPLHDPDLARRLLAEAGLPGGLQATLHVRKLFTDAARLASDQLREVGVRLDVVSVGDQEFLDAARRREYSLILSRFGCPTGDASDILDVALHTFDPPKRMGTNNYGGYSNTEVDRAIEESAGIDNLQDRRAALEEILARLMDDLPWVPLYVDQDVYAFDRRLAWTPRNDSFLLAAEIGVR